MVYHRCSGVCVGLENGRKGRPGHLQFRCSEKQHHELKRWVDLSGLSTAKVLELLLSDFLNDDLQFRPESAVMQVIKNEPKLLEEYNEAYRIRHKGV